MVGGSLLWFVSGLGACSYIFYQGYDMSVYRIYKYISVCIQMYGGCPKNNRAHLGLIRVQKGTTAALGAEYGPTTLALHPFLSMSGEAWRDQQVVVFYNASWGLHFRPIQYPEART